MIQQEQDLSAKRSDEQALFAAAASGDLSAREQIILNHLSIARKYAKEYSDRGVPAEDLYQEGCYGLIVALNRFDPTRGTPFAYFAPHYVLKYIKLAITEQNTRYPGKYNERLMYELKRYCSVYDELSEQNKQPPTEEQLSASLGRSVRHIRNIKFAAYQFLSVSQDINDPAYEIAASVSAHPSSRPIEDSIMESILDLESFGIKLTKREEEVVSRRLGFTKAGAPQTWVEISASMGLSVFWVRQAYSIAMEKIRTSLDSLE